ncbi:MAG: 2-iminoacetate synthase ThiH [Oscillospiraceae bacterium]|jgi:2-iminoacetate synthase|nr:2-iminoacetate synthase ThiH [Oscillospiraceae bacterium]
MKQFPYDPMEYQPGMEEIPSGIMAQVLGETAAFAPEAYTPADVRRALAQPSKTPADFAALLSPAAAPLLEELAQAALPETRRWFGNSIHLFTPLYIANYCENHCTYCGFSCNHKIRRGKLSADDIRREAETIAATGLREILLLTGECRSASGVEYIGEAIELLREYFGVIGVEIYPLNTEEYRALHECGADYVSVYQETYDTALYDRVHPLGAKRSYPYRFNAQERALRGGMRGVAFGSLLGLGEFRHDAFAAGMHAWRLQREFPYAEIAFSFPRIRPISPEGANESAAQPAPPQAVDEARLLQVMLAYRLFLPFAGITVSTRERAGFRDRAAGLVATKVSAGVSVGVGGHSEEAKGDPQFTLADPRSVAEVRQALAVQGLQAVMQDYVRV